MAEVKSINEFYDPTRSFDVASRYMQGQQHLAMQQQGLQAQQQNQEIDNLRQATETAIKENPMQAPALYNEYMKAVGGPPLTDPAAFIANPQPYFDQMNSQPGSPEQAAATAKINTMGGSQRKRSEEEFARQNEIEGNRRLLTATGGPSDTPSAVALRASGEGQRVAYGALLDPNKKMQEEALKQFQDQQAGIKSELGPLLSMSLKSQHGMEKLRPITAMIAPIQERYEHEVKTVGITKAAGTRRDMVLTNPDIAKYMEDAKASIPNLEKELAEVEGLRLQTLDRAQKIAAGINPQTPEESLHAMVGQTKAQALHEQQLKAQLALAKDPLNPTKHAAVEQMAKQIDARAGELYQAQTALGLRQNAQQETARQHEIANQYTNATAQGQRTFGALPAKAQTTEAAAKIAAELKQSTGVDVKVEDILIKDPNRPQLQVAFNQEKQEAKTVGEAFGEQYNTSQKAGMAATSKLNKLDRMDSLLSGITTGKLTPAITDIQAIAESFGVTVDKTLAGKQAMQALSREMALELRNPSGGAGMPGAMSDQDREFLQSMTPNLSQTNEGNKMIIDTARKVAKRDQDIAKLARTYRKQHGHLDEGFYDEVQAYGDAHPMFKGQKAPGEASTMTPGVPQFHDPEKQKRYEDFKKKHKP